MIGDKWLAVDDDYKTEERYPTIADEGLKLFKYKTTLYYIR